MNSMHGKTGEWFGHPAGLAVLSLTNMWEAFALFGMRTSLVYYLTQDLAYSGHAAIQIYSYSVGAALMMGLVGGSISDRFLRPQTSILLGIVLMGVGTLLLVVPSFLFVGLALNALGYGFFRPTASAEVGNLYSRSDPRLTRGFTLFLVVSNSGGALAPIACGWVGVTFGWGKCFLMSGGLMLLAGVIFWVGRRTLRPSGGRSDAPDDAASEPRPMRSAYLGLIVIWLGAACVWTSYNQIGGAVALWAEQSVDRLIHFGSFALEIPAAWFQSVNPILIILLAPLVSRPSVARPLDASVRLDLVKLACGALLIGGLYWLLSAAALRAGANPVNCLWLLLGLIPFTLGELLFSPSGQSLFSRLAPVSKSAKVMSIWFLTNMAGYFGAGWIGSLWDQTSPAAFFGLTGFVSLLAVALFLLVRHRIGGKAEHSQ